MRFPITGCFVFRGVCLLGSVFALFSISSTVRADDCTRILTTIQSLKEIPKNVLPERGLKRSVSGLVAFHGTSSERFLSVQNLFSGHYEILFKDGLSVWSLHPESLRRRGQISSFQLMNDDSPNWRNAEYQRIFRDRRAWPTQQSLLSSFAMNYALGSMQGDIPLVLGFQPSLFQQHRFRLNRGDSNDSANRSLFSYPTFVPSSDFGIPFDHLHSLWFANDSDRKAFNQELEETQWAFAQSLQPREEPKRGLSSLEDAFETFKNRPGLFMTMMEDPSNRELMKDLDQSWQRQFREIHPDTWDFFVELHGLELGIASLER